MWKGDVGRFFLDDPRGVVFARGPSSFGEWEEGKHPRDRGKFSGKPGGGRDRRARKRQTLSRGDATAVGGEAHGPQQEAVKVLAGLHESLAGRLTREGAKTLIADARKTVPQQVKQSVLAALPAALKGTTDVLADAYGGPQPKLEKIVRGVGKRYATALAELVKDRLDEVARQAEQGLRGASSVRLESAGLLRSLADRGEGGLLSQAVELAAGGVDDLADEMGEADWPADVGAAFGDFSGTAQSVSADLAERGVKVPPREGEDIHEYYDRVDQVVRSRQKVAARMILESVQEDLLGGPAWQPWQESSFGEKKDAIGRRYCWDDNTGKRVPCPPIAKEKKERKPAAKSPPPKAKPTPAHTVDSVHAALVKAKAEPEKLTAEHMATFADMLGSLKVDEIKEVNKRLSGVKGSGAKQALVQDVLKRAGVKAAEESAEQAKAPESAPAGGKKPSLLERLRAQKKTGKETATPDWSDRAVKQIEQFTRRHPSESYSLSDLYRDVAEPQGVSLGEFHDGLRRLSREGRIRLVEWTQPLRTMKDERFALVDGGEIRSHVRPGSGPASAAAKSPEVKPPTEEEALTAKAAKEKFTGTLTDSLGREYYFEDGKRVAKPPEAAADVGKGLDLGGGAAPKAVADPVQAVLDAYEGAASYHQRQVAARNAIDALSPADRAKVFEELGIDPEEYHQPGGSNLPDRIASELLRRREQPQEKPPEVKPPKAKKPEVESHPHAGLSREPLSRAEAARMVQRYQGDGPDRSYRYRLEALAGALAEGRHDDISKGLISTAVGALNVDDPQMRQDASRVIGSALAAAPEAAKQEVEEQLRRTLGVVRGTKDVTSPEKVQSLPGPYVDFLKARGYTLPGRPPEAKPPEKAAQPGAPAPQAVFKLDPSLHPEAKAQIKRLAEGLRASPGLSAEQKHVYLGHVQDVVKRMSPEAVKRFGAGLHDPPVFAPTIEGVRTSLMDLYKNSPAISGKLAAVKGEIGGCYAKTGGRHRLVLDGGHSDKVKGKDVGKTAPQLYAHEFSHAIDGPRKELSSSAGWQEAFGEELAGQQLNRYSSTSPEEGFAEFGRLLLGGEHDPAEVRGRFPKCYAFWESKSLVRGGA